MLLFFTVFTRNVSPFEKAALLQPDAAGAIVYKLVVASSSVTTKP